MYAQLVRQSARLVLFAAMLVVFFILLVIPAAATTWTDFQAAASVLGQSTFAGNSTSLPTASNFTSPRGIAVDPITGKVFVADNGNTRVLRFSAVAAMSNGSAAEAVLGQPDFTHNDFDTKQNMMCSPNDVFVDSVGSLWVADTCSHRVLRFDNAASKLNGADADGVLGQPDFTSNTGATTQSGMFSPIGVFIDSGGRLWVADNTNDRVLRFDNAASKANGANADGVLGQPNFTSHVGRTAQNGMSMPYHVFGDGAGRLWVVDRNNNRVLRFDNAASKPNGADADGVLGQINFTTSAALDTTATGMKSPDGVTVDAQGRLYVADETNNRVLIFNNAATLGNGAAACNVLGQPNFTSSTINNGGASAKSLYGPIGVFFDVGRDNLWVADSPNQRVLRFGTAASSNADLCNLMLSSGTLSPAFASPTTTYIASIANNITSLTVTSIAADPQATIKVNGTTVASGAASGAINLNVSDNPIMMVVTSQDGTTTKTYTIIVPHAPNLVWLPLIIK